MADVPEVAVTGVNLFFVLFNWDFVLFGVIDGCFPAGKCKLRVFPRCDNF